MFFIHASIKETNGSPPHPFHRTCVDAVGPAANVHHTTAVDQAGLHASLHHRAGLADQQPSFSHRLQPLRHRAVQRPRRLRLGLILLRAPAVRQHRRVRLCGNTIPTSVHRKLRNPDLLAMPAVRRNLWPRARQSAPGLLQFHQRRWIRHTAG